LNQATRLKTEGPWASAHRDWEQRVTCTKDPSVELQ